MDANKSTRFQFGLGSLFLLMTLIAVSIALEPVPRLVLHSVAMIAWLIAAFWVTRRSRKA
jgi:hypothetical protein